MPPKTRYTPERIIEAALSLTRSAGIDAVTARSVAAVLGCSTGPLFTHFGSMDGLHEQLMDRVIECFVESAAQAQHPDPLVAAGIGWLTFAGDEPRLYEAVFLRRHPWSAKWGPVRRRLAERLGEHPRYGHLEPAARFALVGRASIVLHGLGLELWSGRLPARQLERLVTQLTLPVVEAALAHHWLDDLHSEPTAPLGDHHV